MNLLKHLCFLTCCLTASFLQAEDVDCKTCNGKIELAPAYLHIDVLESGKTIKSLDFGGIRGEIAYVITHGFYVKPWFLYAANNGKLCTAGLGIGQCIPLTKKLMVNPSIGINYTYFRTDIDLTVAPGVVLFDVTERNRSYSPYFGLEGLYSFTDYLRASLQFQYAFSSSRVRIEDIPGRTKSHSEGPSYAGMLEYDVTKYWSINLGAAYNITLSKEKHGLRGYGAKLGIARWF